MQDCCGSVCLASQRQLCHKWRDAFLKRDMALHASQLKRALQFMIAAGSVFEVAACKAVATHVALPHTGSFATALLAEQYLQGHSTCLICHAGVFLCIVVGVLNEHMQVLSSLISLYPPMQLPENLRPT